MNPLLLVPVILVLVQAIKMANYLKPKFLSLVAVVLGIVAGLIWGDITSLSGILTALIPGLAASGLWEVGSTALAVK
jgi:hypothetical protein